MSHLLNKYRRVTENEPCPKCGRPDWCLLRHDGRTCICSRLESGKPFGEAGWLHYLPDGAVAPVVEPRKQKVYLNTQQVRAYIDSTSDDADMLKRQAKLLELSPAALSLMQAKYASDKAAVVFPMFNGSRDPVGCRLRRSDGRKWSLKGGREGVFLSREFDPGNPVFICEGPTDSAALCHAGFSNVIGRPNCSGGASIISTLMGGYRMTPVIILADNDPNEAGATGAARLANSLPNPCIVLIGPTDVREFITRQCLTNDPKRDILDGIDGDELSTWRPIYHNQSGKFYPYLRHFKVAA